MAAGRGAKPKCVPFSLAPERITFPLPPVPPQGSETQAEKLRIVLPPHSPTLSLPHPMHKGALKPPPAPQKSLTCQQCPSLPHT